MIRGGFGLSYNQNEIAITANGNGNPPNAVQASFTCPYPFTDPTCASTGILYETATNVHSIFGYAPNPNAIKTFGSNNLPVGGSPIFVTGFPSSPKTIYSEHYSLDMQYQLPFNMVATVGYQGNRTRNLLIQNNWLAIAAANGLAMNPQVNFVDYYENAGNANFNAGIASLTHNFSHSFSYQRNTPGPKRWTKIRARMKRIHTPLIPRLPMDGLTTTLPMPSSSSGCGSRCCSTAAIAGLRRWRVGGR